MSIRNPVAGLLALLAATCALPASAQRGVPETIKQRVNELVAACAQAGGQLGTMSGQGQFVIPADFSGDGQPDFVVSEGNLPCTGKPDLFRRDGQARVELFLADGEGDVRLAFADDLLAYRVLDGRPAKLQIARKGAGCGAGSPPAAQCGAELRWNAGTRGFDEVPTGSRNGAPAIGVRPAVIQGAVASAGPAAPPAADATASAGAAAPKATVPANAGAAFVAACTKDLRARHPQIAADSAARDCAYQWEKILASGELADAVLAAVPARTGERPGVADLRARLPQVRWDARPQSQGAQGSFLATGRWNALQVYVEGPAPASRLNLAWAEVGAEWPYDLPGALRARGAKVESLGCYHFGSVEQNQVYVVSLPPRPPFALTIYQLGAAFANSNASQVFTLDLTGKLPTLAALRAEHRDPPWTVPCPA
jgi:hypothetical protein